MWVLKKDCLKNVGHETGFDKTTVRGRKRGGETAFGFEPRTVDSYTMSYNLNYQCHIILVSFRDRYRATIVAATTALTRSPDRRRTGTPSK